MINTLAEFLKYTEVADNLVIDTFRSCAPPEKALALFSHVLNVQHIWASRILGSELCYTSQQIHAAGAFAAISKNNWCMLREILKEVPMERSVSYANSAGEQFTGVAGDIIFHVVNHSTYHRAQIASELRRYDIAPPVTDFIILKRQGLL